MTNPYLMLDDEDPYDPPKRPTTKKASAAAGGFQGLFQDAGDELLAGAGTLVQKITGDKRPMRDIYRQLQADADQNIKATAAANAGTAAIGRAGGAVAGVLASGAGQALPKTLTATVGRRLLSAAGVGAVTGGASAAAGADPGERLAAVPEGMLWGGAFGLGGQAVGEVGKQGGRVIGLGPKALPASASASAGSTAAPASPVGPVSGPRLTSGPGRVSNAIARVQKTLGMETAEEAGARHVLAAAAKEGKDVAGLQNTLAGADPTTTVAEGIGKRGMTLTRTVRAVGPTASGRIDDALEDRAANETARLSGKLKELTGATARDADTVAREEMDKVRPTTKQLYGKTQGRYVADAPAEAVLAEIKDLEDAGVGILKSARAADKNFPKELDGAFTVGHIQRLRQVLDKKINYGESREGMASIEAAAQDRLKDLRASLDDLAKTYGGDDFVDADAITAEAARKGRSFAKGEDALRAMSDDQLDELVTKGGDPEFFRQGVGSGLQKKLAGVADEGSIQNPVPRVLGGQAKRTVARRAFTDDATFDTFRQAGKDAASRLKFFRDVTGGSQTFDKAADAVGFVADVGPLKETPRGMIEKALQSAVAKRLLAQTGVEADAAAEYLMAGAPGFKSQADALAALEKLAPIIGKRLSGQTVRRSAAASAARPQQR